MSVKEIEQAIEQLPAHELAELTNWLTAYHAANRSQQAEVVIDLSPLKSPIHLRSPRLARPSDTVYFRQEVSEEKTGAGL